MSVLDADERSRTMLRTQAVRDAERGWALGGESIIEFYERGREEARLTSGDGVLEYERTCLLLARHLPPPPARILDVGGGTGRYAAWLAGLGYEVTLVDPVPLHIEQAKARAASGPSFEATVGDACALDCADSSFDAVIALGPFYHLPDRNDRLQAWRETVRVVRPGGIVVAAAISRLASLLDGAHRGITDPAFWTIVERDLRDGQHLPTDDGRYFTTAFFHTPEELRTEASDAGLIRASLFAIEGPLWLLDDLDVRHASPERWRVLMDAIERIESEASAMAASNHILLVARRAGQSNDALDVRPLVESDLPFIAEMTLLAAFPPGPLPEGARGKPRVVRWTQDWGRPGDAGVVAWREGRLVGAAWCRVQEEAPVQGEDGPLPEVAIGVVPEERSHGVGERLLNALVSQAAQAGQSALSLTVNAQNPAHRLYERVGFVLDRRDGDCLTMVKRAGCVKS